MNNMSNKEHCLIGGKRCSKCCEVLTIRVSKIFRDWQSYIRRYGYQHLDIKEYPNKKELQIYGMIKKISKRRAKKINPRLVSIVKNSQSYFTCKHLKGGKCNNYENRPNMCSGYPYYGKGEQEFKDYIKSESFESGLYVDNCTYYVSL